METYVGFSILIQKHFIFVMGVVNKIFSREKSVTFMTIQY